MSYFSQKKNQKRINILLTSSLSLVGVVFLAGLFFSSGDIADFVNIACHLNNMYYIFAHLVVKHSHLQN